ncbi:cytochrome c [Hymenobacter lapidiphilus]|uniref:c-type cytochrome n=1 Tax=Hymenobacter sp. CCM 8763 TaxID=2303334 RepID=UPI000E34FDDA|nr:c-type cytochrome [Hymenobacter sp. CCM 8763]RFP63775.1 cytochrome c [Hymenobacter sp. CCM 8763]
MAFSTNLPSIRSLVLATALFAGATAFSACGGSETPTETTTSTGSVYESEAAKKTLAKAGTEEASAGIFTADQVKLSPIVDKAMAAKGKALSELKCQSCHSMGSNRVVGPGWENITETRAPEWILNMIVHTDKMLETDPEAQKALEQCMVRMPNQGLSETEGREVLEYMRTLVAKK